MGVFVCGCVLLLLMCMCGVGECGCVCVWVCFTFVNVHNILCPNCRNFHFELYPDTSVFSDDFRLSVDGRLRRHTDMSVYYSGRAVGMYSVLCACFMTILECYDCPSIPTR